MYVLNSSGGSDKHTVSAVWVSDTLNIWTCDVTFDSPIETSEFCSRRLGQTSVSRAIPRLIAPLKATHRLILMWQQYKQKREQQLRFATPEHQLVLSTYTMPSTGQAPKLSTMNLHQDVGSAFTSDISQIPAAVRNTEAHLSSRHREISQWRSQIAECVSRVNREISLMDQMIDTVESRLAEQQQCSRLVFECVSLCNSITVDFVKQHTVMVELQREEGLNTEVKVMLQKQIQALNHKLNCLKEIRSRLSSDHQDKTTAVRLTSTCITLDLRAPSSQFPASRYQPCHVSYDHWLNNCQSLKTSADKQVEEASSFRASLRFTISNVRHAQDCQRQKVDSVLRKVIHNLKKAEDTMLWESHEIQTEITSLRKTILNIASQAQNCDTRLHQATHRLDLLNYRPRNELCIDQPLVCLTMEKRDLTNIAIGLCPVLNRSQQNMELAIRRLRIVKDKLAKIANALDIMYRCQNRHQTLYPQSHSTTVVISRPGARVAQGSSFFH